MRVRDFRRRACLVIGGSKGIGRALAQQLVARGADVALVARGRPALESATVELLSSRRFADQQIHAYCADVTDPDETQEVIAKIVSELGRPPEVVFICSGSCRPGAFADISPAMVQQAMALNFFGVWNVAQTVLPWMRESGGVIVPTASVAGFVGLYGYTAYAASKFAVVGFAESLRNELAGSRVRVAVLCPPDTLTPGLSEERKTRPPETEAISSGTSELSAHDVAHFALKALGTGAFVIIPGRAARFACWVKRLFPGLVRANLDATVRKVKLSAHAESTEGHRLRVRTLVSEHSVDRF